MAQAETMSLNESGGRFAVTSRQLRGFAVTLVAAIAVAGQATAPAMAQDAPPANDSFATPTVIGLADLPYTTTQDSLFATQNTDGIADPSPVCDSATGFTVWYKLTTGSSGLTVSATTDLGDFFPPSVNVYQLKANKLYPAGCGTSGAVQLKAATTYYFMLASFTARPTFSFTVQAQ